MVSVAEVLTAEYLEDGRRASWAPHLRGEFDRPYMHQLRQFLENEESNDRLLPTPERIFEALEETTLEEVKVVIIGQDPYPKPHRAHGLAFSTLRRKRPDSLRGILAEVERNMGRSVAANDRNCLTPWARQGVLLLNRALTVRKRCAKKHLDKGWKCFTDRIVETVSRHREHIVFMLWGDEAKKVRGKIDASRHKVLCWQHPVGTTKGMKKGLEGSKHFSQANQYLEAHNAEPIDWLDVCRRPPLDEQDSVPPLTSADADDEARWDRAFAESIPQLERLAAEATQQQSLGQAQELDPSQP